MSEAQAKTLEQLKEEAPSLEDPIQDDKVEDDVDPEPNLDEDSGTGDGQEDTDAEEEIEIVRESKGSQPLDKKTQAFSDRVNKLNRKREEAVDAATEEAKNKSDLLEQENNLLRSKLNELSGQPKPLTQPVPDDLDGLDGPEYLKQKADFDKAVIREIIQEDNAKQSQSRIQDDSDHEFLDKLRGKQVAHYERAASLKVKDFGVVEDKAIEIFGKDNINSIINHFPKESELITFYLGTEANEAESKAIALLFKKEKTRVDGLIALTDLRSDLKKRPKSKKTVSDPDDELEGASPSGKVSNDTKLERLRTKAQSGKSSDMTNLMEFKKKLREKKK